jgi:hypothetical protein
MEIQAMLKKILLSALIGASFASVPLQSFAQRERVVVIREAPPAPRQEAAPSARRGYVWVPGHYEYRRRGYEWVSGHWLRERRGYAYNAPRWVERNGQWVMEQGRWARGGMRDRDGDGVPNRLDARPNNPNRN